MLGLFEIRLSWLFDKEKQKYFKERKIMYLTKTKLIIFFTGVFLFWASVNAEQVSKEPVLSIEAILIEDGAPDDILDDLILRILDLVSRSYEDPDAFDPDFGDSSLEYRLKFFTKWFKSMEAPEYY